MADLSKVDFASDQHSLLNRPTRIKRRFLLASITLALTLSWGGEALASDEIIDTETRTIAATTAYPGQQLIVGLNNTGVLTVSGGGTVDNRTSTIGYNAGSNGTVIVTGTGSTWTNPEDLDVGGSGTGTLTISDGGKVNNQNGTIGHYAGSTGTVTVTGTDSTWTNSNELVVGWSSTGTLTIENGGTVSSTNGFLGARDGGNGTVTVTGAGSTWNNSKQLILGYVDPSGSSTGVLTIENGGTVINTDARIGLSAGSTGTVTVTGAGSTLTDNGTSLRVGRDGTGTLTIAEGGLVTVGTETNGAYSGTLAIAFSTGSTGTVNIGAASGSAAVAAGTLKAAAVEFGSGTGKLVFNHTSTNYSLGANISGAGQIIAENGVTTLTGNNTYTGGTTISGGTLAGIATSFGSGAIANNSALIVDGSGTLTNTVSGSGSFTKTGSGTLALTGNNTYTGGTTISGGTLSVTTDNLMGNVVNNATLLIDQDTDGTFAGNISGSGDLVKDGTGTVNMAGTLTYTGATTVLNGQLVGNTTALGGSVANNGQVAFDQSFAGTYNNVISGTGSLLKNGTGTVILTNDNTYTGGTTISGGTLQVGNGGTTGSITGDVVNNGVLAFDRSDGVTLSGQITGAGAIRQLGSGLVSLTGNSGTFTGTTTVEAGSLKVNGTLGGVLDIQTSGRLQGTGTVGNLTMNGVIAPGNSIGTLNVAGDITFNTGSVYEVETNAAGQADRINASGTATINGGSVQVLAATGNYAPATTYTILSATNGVSGTFTDGVTSNLAFLDPSLSYDTNNVYLRLTRNDVTFDGIGLTPNQITAGKGTESLTLGNSIYDAVLNLSSDQARHAFDQLSGELHASVATTLIEDSRFVRNAMNDRLRVKANAPGAWSQAFGSWGHTSSNGNAAKMDRSTGGFLFGSDIPASDTWRFGAVAGYSHTSFDVKARNSSGSSDNYHLGLYGGSDWGQLGFRSGLAYTWHNIDTTRSVMFPGFSDRLSGGYHAGTFQAFSELSYGTEKGVTKLEPFVNLSYVNFDANSLRESGGAAALNGSGVSMDTLFTTLGLRTTASVNLGKKAVTARSLLGWRHAYGDTIPTATMSYASGSSAFTLGGVPIARDAAVVEAGLDFTLSPTKTLAISYNGQFANHLVDQSFKANLSMKF
ncbi:autotransporter domain-containing protein [Sporomusa aerivorans]|uniref:autotransporter domain-containing protein n=1 Tax=Sporomusa aerivorans TaxID=204936 RepID=UPI00352AC097